MFLFLVQLYSYIKNYISSSSLETMTFRIIWVPKQHLFKLCVVSGLNWEKPEVYKIGKQINIIVSISRTAKANNFSFSAENWNNTSIMNHAISSTSLRQHLYVDWDSLWSKVRGSAISKVANSWVWAHQF